MINRLQFCFQNQLAAVHSGETFGTLIALLFAQAAVKGLAEEFKAGAHTRPLLTST